MLDLFIGGVVTHQVVVLVIPCEAPGADLIKGAVKPEHLLLFFIPLEIPEGDLPVFIDGGVQRVHIVIDFLVRGLDAPGDDHLALQLLRLIGVD